MVQSRRSRHVYVRSLRTVRLKKPLQPSQLIKNRKYEFLDFLHEALPKMVDLELQKTAELE